MNRATHSVAPAVATGFFQPRRAAFWLLVATVAAGLWFVLDVMRTGFATVPVTVAVATVVWALYALPILAFFRRLDVFALHPPLGFVLAFVWGGFAAAFLAVPANGAVFGLCAKLISPEFCARWGAAVAGPTNEEPLKLLGVALLVLVARHQFRSVLSVVTLGAMSGLGFQVVENWFYTINASLNHANPDQLEPVLRMFVVRGGLCGPWSHTAYTSVASFGLGWYLAHPDRPLPRRLGVAAGAFLAAWTMHFVWNSPLLTETFDGLWVLAMFPAKGLPVAVGAGLVWYVAQREENTHLADIAEQTVPPDLIRPEERAALGSHTRRRQLRRELRQTRGRTAAAILRDLHRAQLRLVRYCAEDGTAGGFARHAARVRDARQRLAALNPTA